MKKSAFVIALLGAATCGLLACGCDDSSAGPNNGNPGDPNVGAPTSLPDTVTTLDSQAESSSDAIDESPSSSSESSLPVFEPATDCYEGGAQITISNIENLNMQCGGSTEGWTVYDKDHWTLYTCTGGDWIEEEAIPCVMD